MQKCFFCGSSAVVKNGHKSGRQLYLCKSCGRQFVGGRRLSTPDLITEYVEGKQTIAQLSKSHGVSKSTIWRRLSGMRHIRVVPSEKDVVIQLDTTYWGRGFGLMVIKDVFRKRILWRKFVRNETLSDYMEGVSWLRQNGFCIYGAVCDGFKGLILSLSEMCQFHQMMIVRRYLTKAPELDASKELLQLVKRMTEMNGQEFKAELDAWHARWKDFLDERSKDPKSGKTRYTHRRTRSAWLSIKRNMPWLWTFELFENLHLPRTNNALEGCFADIKTKMRVHSGISKERRECLIDEYIARKY